MSRDATVPRVSEIRRLTEAVREFAVARDWEQFHNPKNLAMALGGEIGELLAELQWLTDDEIRHGLQIGEPLRPRVEDELGDVFLYLARFADVCGIQLTEVAWAKLARNETRYPVSKAWGRSEKYSRLSDPRGNIS
jgi:NTP pyrophosphatase (non-canonical NTP hydrolase)